MAAVATAAGATYLGLIGGSNFLKSKYFLSGVFTPREVDTEFGRVRLYVDESSRVIFVQRHAADPAVPYSPPHLINKRAIVRALKDLGCARVVAFNSTGTMKRSIPLGALVVPDDFVCLDPISFFTDGRAHLVPGFNKPLRQRLIGLLQGAGLGASLVTSAVYVQTHGPRFETEAEIRLFALVSDIVGASAAGCSSVRPGWTACVTACTELTACVTA